MVLKQEEELEKIRGKKIKNNWRGNDEDRVSLVERVDGIIKQKKEKVKDLRLGIWKEEQDRAKGDCTFKPKINKRSSSKRRSVNDLFRWQKDCQKKQMEKEMKKVKGEKKRIPKALKRSRKMVDSERVPVEDRLLYRAKLKQEKLDKSKEEQNKGLFKPIKYSQRNGVRSSKNKKKKRIRMNPEEIAHDLCKVDYEDRSLEKFRVEQYNKSREAKARRSRKRSRKRAVFEYDAKSGVRVPVFSERKKVAEDIKYGRKIDLKARKGSRKKAESRKRGKKRINQPKIDVFEDFENRMKDENIYEREDGFDEKEEQEVEFGQDGYEEEEEMYGEEDYATFRQGIDPEDIEIEAMEDEDESDEEEEFIVEPIIINDDESDDEQIFENSAQDQQKPIGREYNLPPKAIRKNSNNFKNKKIQEKITIPKTWLMNKSKEEAIRTQVHSTTNQF